MPTCERCAAKTPLLEIRNGLCWNCRTAEEATAKNTQSAAEKAARAAADAMPATTSFYLPGMDDHDVLGIVAGETVAGINALKEVAVVIRDAVGGRSATLQAALRESRESSLREMKAEAIKLNADAIIGVQVTYGEAPSGRPGSMLLVVATGTAIRRKSSVTPTVGAS